MTINQRNRLQAGLAGAAALVAVAMTFVAATPANAAVRGLCLFEDSVGTLPSGGASLASVGQGFLDVHPTAPYWSVVATRGSQGHNAGIQLNNAPATTCNQLDAIDDANNGVADWVAFDNNSGRLPIQPYAAGFFPVGKFVWQFVAGGQTLSTTEPTVSQPLGTAGDWIADIHDVYLQGGHSYTFKVTGGFTSIFVVHSKASDASTWTRTKATVSAQVNLPDVVPPGQPYVDLLSTNRTASLTLHDTNVTDWFGLLVVRDGWWGNPASIKITTTTP